MYWNKGKLWVMLDPYNICSNPDLKSYEMQISYQFRLTYSESIFFYHILHSLILGYIIHLKNKSMIFINNRKKFLYQHDRHQIIISKSYFPKSAICFVVSVIGILWSIISLYFISPISNFRSCVFRKNSWNKLQ